MTYIRVATKASDNYTQLTDMYAVAFKTIDASVGPYNVETEKNDLKGFIESKKDNGVIKRMFENTEGYPDTVDTGSARYMIAYLDKVYNDRDGSDNAAVESTTNQAYYVYIYAKNSTEYVLLKPTEVAVTE